MLEKLTAIRRLAALTGEGLFIDMKPEHSCAEGTESSWTLQKEPDTSQLSPHASQGQPSSYRKHYETYCTSETKEQQGEEKPAAPWATALASYGHLAERDNSHSGASSLSVTLSSHHCKLQ